MQAFSLQSRQFLFGDDAENLRSFDPTGCPAVKVGAIAGASPTVRLRAEAARDIVKLTRQVTVAVIQRIRLQGNHFAFDTPVIRSRLYIVLSETRGSSISFGAFLCFQSDGFCPEVLCEPLHDLLISV